MAKGTWFVANVETDTEQTVVLDWGTDEVSVSESLAASWPTTGPVLVTVRRASTHEFLTLEMREDFLARQRF